MADHIVKGSADALGESVIMERGGDAAVLCRKVIDQAVDLGSAHAFVNVGRDVIKDGCIERRALLDGFDLGRGL